MVEQKHFVCFNTMLWTPNMLFQIKAKYLLLEEVKSLCEPQMLQNILIAEKINWLNKQIIKKWSLPPVLLSHLPLL